MIYASKQKRTIVIDKVKISPGVWMLAVYFFLIPFDFFPLLPGVSVSRVVVFFPIIAIIPRLSKLRFAVSGDFFKQFFSLALYLLFVATSIFYSVNAPLSISFFNTMFVNIGIVFFFSFVTYSEREKDLLIKAVALSGWLVVILFLLSYDPRSMIRGDIIINGISQDPNYLCGYLLFSISYYLQKVLQEKERRHFISILIFLLVVLLTGSRGGLISFAVVTVVSVVCICFNNRGNRNFFSRLFRGLFILLLICIAVYYILQQLPSDLSDRFYNIFKFEDKGAGRFVLWDETLRVFKNSDMPHKIFGIGFGTIGLFTHNNHITHNLWLQLLAEGGLVGFVLLLLVYFYAFRSALRLKNMVLISTFFAYLAMSFSLSLFYYKPIWNLFLIILILSREKSEEKNADNISIH